MSRRRRQGLSPSLFPFLAVLVCTLGTLILLLALVAQNATEVAERNASNQRVATAELLAAEAEPVVPRLTAESAEMLLNEERFRTEQLVAFRDKQTADLEDRRDQLTHIEDHMQRVRDKLSRLSKEVELAMSDAGFSVDEETLARLRAKLEQERTAVEQLLEAAESHQPRVVIVPHKGPNGTDRRPVYLECTADGLTIWPEGSQITMSQLEDSNYSANPLDAALRTVRYHALQNYGDTVAPYPLLIVRPDGIDTYAAARGAMRDWDDQFGYELVPGEVKLAYTTPDPELKRRIDVAIRDAAAQQYAQHAIARRTFGGNGFTRTMDDGDLPVGSGTRSRGGGKLPTLSAAELDRQGRSSGFKSLRDYASNRDMAVQRGRQWPGVQGQPNRRPPPQDYAQLPDRDSGWDRGLSMPQGDSAAEHARAVAEQMHQAASEMRTNEGVAPGTSSNPYTSADATRMQPAGQMQQPKMQQPNQQQPNQQQPNQQQPNQSGSDSDGDPSMTSPATEAIARDMVARRSPSSSFSTGDQRNAQGGSAASASPSAMASPSATKPDGAPQDPPSDLSTAPATAPPTELVQREGRDWALPPWMAGMGGNSVVRTIRVRAYPDRFELPSGSPSRNGTTFAIEDGDIDYATMRLATALRDRIDLWGPALPGARWKPRLDVIVTPGSEMLFHQLRTYMSGSGIEVTGRASR